MGLILQQSGSANSWVSFVPMVAIFAIFYFLLFLPMQRQKKKQQKLLAELKNGDEVVTSGGLIGTISSMDGDRVTLRVKPGDVKLQVTRASVSTVLGGEGKK